MIQMCKTIKAIFTCVALGKEIPQLDPKDFSQFPLLNEAWVDLERHEDMDFAVDITQSKNPHWLLIALYSCNYLDDLLSFYLSTFLSFGSTWMLVFGLSEATRCLIYNPFSHYSCLTLVDI